MAHSSYMRVLNKHMKIVLVQKVGSSDYNVLQTTGTLSPRIGTTLDMQEAQGYIDDGYTVIIKAPKR